jgi:hypothetical protein
MRTLMKIFLMLLGIGSCLYGVIASTPFASIIGLMFLLMYDNIVTHDKLNDLRNWVTSCNVVTVTMIDTMLTKKLEKPSGDPAS